jgi:hypothetical protein
MRKELVTWATGGNWGGGGSKFLLVLLRGSICQLVA